jgi:hypothetical protein
MDSLKKLEIWIWAIGTTLGAAYFIHGLFPSFWGGMGDIQSIQMPQFGSQQIPVAGRAFAGVLCIVLAIAAWWSLLSDWRLKRRLRFRQPNEEPTPEAKKSNPAEPPR